MGNKPAYTSYSKPAIRSEAPPHPRLLPPFLLAFLVVRSMWRSLNNHHSCTTGISYPIHREERSTSPCTLSFDWRLARKQAPVKREWSGTDTDVEGGRFFWERWQNARNLRLRDFLHTAIVTTGTIGCDGRVGKVGQIA